MIRRDEGYTAPHEVYYRFGGKQLGMVGNDGTANTDYTRSIASRTATPGTGAFRGSASYGGSYADFGQDYDAVNSYAQGSAGGSYTVRSGESLFWLMAERVELEPLA